MLDSVIDAEMARPLYSESPLYAEYFEGLKQRRITVPMCAGCETVQWPPRELCGVCQNSRFVPANMPTEGEAYTYSVMYRAFHPAFRDAVPYGVVVVEVAKGVRIIGRYVGSDPGSLECGQRMTAVFDDLGIDSGSIAWQRIG